MEIKDKYIPYSIKIDNYHNAFKQRKSNKKFTYSCKSRKCGVIISIDADNLNKIINNITEGNFEYNMNSKKDHICIKILV